MCLCTLPPEVSLIIHMLIIKLLGAVIWKRTKKERTTAEILKNNKNPFPAIRKSKQIHVITILCISIVHLKKLR
ncbi:hypothetical protein EUGRSUZ_C01510 [Eucalyptus grandis]|uniref:Uncharacterized protein n=2 Tax=Eucalyptus grandis TaxID=71139 RepID=A0A059CPN8_EUCGR|nr:hypothetical protein EUGRSUZ_C01510 [Eucalyptus grandis]